MATNAKMQMFDDSQEDRDAMLFAMDMLRSMQEQKHVILLMDISELGDARLKEIRGTVDEPDVEEVKQRVRWLLSNAMALATLDGLDEITRVLGAPDVVAALDMRCEKHDHHEAHPTVN